MTFDATIANVGNVMARDALLYEVNRGEIRRLAVLPLGEPSVCSAGYEVAEDSQFVFCLNYTDADGRQRTVSTEPIDVAIAPDGVSPEQVGRAGMDLEGESVKLGGNSATFIVLLIIAGRRADGDGHPAGRHVPARPPRPAQARRRRKAAHQGRDGQDRRHPRP